MSAKSVSHSEKKTSLASTQISNAAVVDSKKVTLPLVSITPTITPKPTPSPSPTPTPTIKPTPTTDSQNSSIAPADVSSTILNQVNDFRASKGLYAVQTDGYTCAFATIRAQEIASGFNHDGFDNRASSHNLPYPSYSYVNENIALNSDPNQVVAAWIASPGHNENMQKDTPYVCIARNGNYYAYEGWKP